MKKHIRVWMGLLCCLGWLWPINTGADDQTVLKLPVYRSEGQLWMDERGELQGFRLQILKELNRILEPDRIALRYVRLERGEVPIKRCIHEILTGRYDAYFGLIHSRQREKRGLIYSKTAIYAVPTMVWMNRKNSFDYQGPDSLQGKRVGVVQGYPYLNDLKDISCILKTPLDDQTNVSLLARGSVDLIVDNLIRTGTVILQSGHGDRIQYASKPFSHSKFHVAYNGAVDKEVREKVDTGLKSLHDSGFIQKILKSRMYSRFSKLAP